jgi:hypothetical protein
VFWAIGHKKNLTFPFIQFFTYISFVVELYLIPYKGDNMSRPKLHKDKKVSVTIKLLPWQKQVIYSFDRHAIETSSEPSPTRAIEQILAKLGYGTDGNYTCVGQEEKQLPKVKKTK